MGDPRTGLALAAAGCVPFAAGAALSEDTGLPCPYREVTGLPCPLCGASRSFGAFADGGDWTRFGAGWVVVAALAVVAGLAMAAGVRLRVRPWTATAVAVAGSWAWALVHRDAIVG